MRNVLSANFARLFKDRVFCATLAAMLLCAVVTMLSGCRQAAVNAGSGYSYTLDSYYFGLAPTLGLFCAVFTSLFLGTEYSDGTLRNKIMVGHSRASVYLANLAVCFAATLCFAAVWLMGGLVGIPFLGLWKIGITGLAAYSALIFCFSAALSAIFTFVGMNLQSRSASAVLSLLLFLALLVGASMVYARLCQPEMTSGVVITSEGMQMAEPAPNPEYLGGNLRRAYEGLLNFLPTGQGILMANLEVARPLYMLASSALISVGMTLLGVCMFQKKDLK